MSGFDQQDPQLEPLDRQELNKLLSDIPELAKEDGRRHILHLAGLSEFVPRMELAGSTSIVLGTMVTFLEKYGRFKNGEAALGKLLIYIKTLVGASQNQFIERLLQKYELIEIKTNSQFYSSQEQPYIQKPPIIDISLKSDRNVDYTKLRDLLEAQKWQEADEETANVMLQAAERTSQGYLSSSDIESIPCEDLRTINQLWLKYSDGKFGFSVQKDIYESLGGTKEYNEEIWSNFSERVGWKRKKGGDWLSYSELTMNLTAPVGHLPHNYTLNDFEVELELVKFSCPACISSLAQRLGTCRIE